MNLFNIKNINILSVLLLSFLLTLPVLAQEKPEPAYTVHSISFPKGLSAETGAIDFLPDGTLVAAFHRGEVYFYHPHHKHWHLFASGLHDPLGLIAISKNEIIVMQRPELTRIKDTDNDMLADDYSVITDDFGISGNYHEFAFGPARDKDGNLYIGLNTASSGAGRRYEVRGKYNPNGRNGRMYACVPWRGWVMKVTPDGEISPFASGFRSPNGLGFDLQGRLYAGDNQGDWIGSSPLYHIEQGKHYGHVASLAWDKRVKGDPLKLPLKTLDAWRTRPAIVFPHGSMANSPTEPIAIPNDKRFGPFAGQMLIGEMNQKRIIRLMLEEVDGVMQGACVPFLDNNGLQTGNNRLTFAPDGSLWVGQTDHGWAGSKGIQQIKFTGHTPFDVKTMSLTKTGFKLTFTQPVNKTLAADKKTYAFERYYYNYHSKYGSPQYGKEAVPITSIKVSEDALTVDITLDNLKAWRVYQLNINNLKNTKGHPLRNSFICYTLNHLRGGNTPPAPLPHGVTGAIQPTPKLPSQPAAKVKVIGTRYEAESAKITGASIRNHVKGYTGKGFVDIQKSDDESITFPLNITKAGDYQIMVRYALPNGARPMSLLLNNKQTKTLDFKATGSKWHDWQYETNTLKLTPGKHTLTIATIGNSGPNIDHIQIVPR